MYIFNDGRDILKLIKFDERIFQPENIVLTERGGQTVKIIDFGTAMQLRKGEKVQKKICNLRQLVHFVNECFLTKKTIFSKIFSSSRCRQWLALQNLLRLRFVFH